MADPVPGRGHLPGSHCLQGTAEAPGAEVGPLRPPGRPGGPRLPCSVFHRGVQELKKVENASRSPWFSHVTSSMQGLGVIHAYDRREDCVHR